MVDADLNVSGVDGYGKDFLNRRKARKREKPAEESPEPEPTKKPKKPAPPPSGDALVDFLA